MQANGEGIRDSDKEGHVRKTKKSKQKMCKLFSLFYIFLCFYAKPQDGPLGPKYLAH